MALLTRFMRPGVPMSDFDQSFHQVNQFDTVVNLKMDSSPVDHVPRHNNAGSIRKDINIWKKI